MPELPEDLLISILKQFPIKPIAQFKCVCKAWRSLLSSSRFVRPHLEFHNPKQFIVTASLDYYIVTLNDYESDDGTAYESDDDTANESDHDAASVTNEDATSEADNGAASVTDDDAASQTSAASASETENDVAVASETDDVATASESGDASASEPDNDEASETSSEDYSEGVARKGRFPVEHKFLLAGSCDGLVLLVLKDKDCSKIVFNPITLESAKVVDNRDLVNPCVYGFGYDRCSDDYKIVCMSKAEDGNGSLVDVYSVRMKSWKRIANSRHVLQNTCFPRREKGPAPGVFLNGCIHWLGSATNPPDHGYEIVCFDLAREEFVQVPLALDRVFKVARESFADRPNPDDRRVEFDISVIDGCLALAMLPINVVNQWWHIHVWVMKEYGVPDSWTQIAHISGSYCDGHFVKIVCGLNKDEIVLAEDGEKLSACNLKNEGCRRRLDIAGFPMFDYPNNFQTVLPLRGSLLSPNYNQHFFA